MILRKVGGVNIFKYRLYISVLEQARVLIPGKYFLLGVINTICKHLILEWSCEMQVKDQFFGSWTLYLSSATCYVVKIMQLCSFSVLK